MVIFNLSRIPFAINRSALNPTVLPEGIKNTPVISAVQRFCGITQHHHRFVSKGSTAPLNPSLPDFSAAGAPLGHSKPLNPTAARDSSLASRPRDRERGGEDSGRGRFALCHETKLTFLYFHFSCLNRKSPTKQNTLQQPPWEVAGSLFFPMIKILLAGFSVSLFQY